MIDAPMANDSRMAGVPTITRLWTGSCRMPFQTNGGRMLNTLLEVKRNTVPNQMSGMLSPLMLTTLITLSASLSWRMAAQMPIGMA